MDHEEVSILCNIIETELKEIVQQLRRINHNLEKARQYKGDYNE